MELFFSYKSVIAHLVHLKRAPQMILDAFKMGCFELKKARSSEIVHGEEVWWVRIWYRKKQTKHRHPDREMRKSSNIFFSSVPVQSSLSRFPHPKKIKTRLTEPAICNRLPSICACQMTYQPTNHNFCLLSLCCLWFPPALPPRVVYSSPGLIPFFWGWLQICEGKNTLIQHLWHQFKIKMYKKKQKKICPARLRVKQPASSPAVDLCFREGPNLCKLPSSSALGAFLQPCSAGW